MSEVNWKDKYLDLKSKFMESVDQAFRLGYEQGAQQAAQDQMAMQQQQEAELQQQAGGVVNNEPGQEQMSQPNAEQQIQPDSQNPAGSELDQHIAKLESMVAKGEVSPEDLKKSLEDFKTIRKAELSKMTFEREMRKSNAAIPGIVKALHKPAFKIGQQASHNMNDNAKRAVNMQHQIVNDVMKKWDEESKQAGSDITKILNNEGK